MKGHCRFLRVQGGKCYFAHVELDVFPDSNGITLDETMPEKVNADAGEVNEQTAPTWVASAQEGIHAAIDQARPLGLLPGGCRVRLTKLVGSFVDTREDVVRCAAALATWQGLGGPEPGPEAVFNGQVWNLLFPAAVGKPAREKSA